MKAAEVLARGECRRVVNFGTAGSRRPELAGQLVRVNRILQRDMDARPLAMLGDTPFEEGPASGMIALGGEGVSLSTGDNFVTAPPALASDIVDMEGYAIAKATLRAGVDFSCWKYVTDLADENATANWRENVEKARRPSSPRCKREGSRERDQARRSAAVKAASPISTAPLPRCSQAIRSRATLLRSCAASSA